MKWNEKQLQRHLYLIISMKYLIFNHILLADWCIAHISAWDEEYWHGTNQSFAATTVHKQPFPVPHYCAIDRLASVASAAQSNDLLQGVIIEHDSATPTWRTSKTIVVAVLSLGTCGQDSPPCCLVHWVPVDRTLHPIVWPTGYLWTGLSTLLFGPLDTCGQDSPLYCLVHWVPVDGTLHPIVWSTGYMWTGLSTLLFGPLGTCGQDSPPYCLVHWSNTGGCYNSTITGKW